MGGGHWGQGLALLSAGWLVTLLTQDTQTCLEFGSRDVHVQPAAGRGRGCLSSAFLLPEVQCQLGGGGGGGQITGSPEKVIASLRPLSLNHLGRMQTCLAPGISIFTSCRDG